MVEALREAIGLLEADEFGEGEEEPLGKGGDEGVVVARGLCGVECSADLKKLRPAPPPAEGEDEFSEPRPRHLGGEEVERGAIGGDRLPTLTLEDRAFHGLHVVVDKNVDLRRDLASVDLKEAREVIEILFQGAGELGVTSFRRGVLLIPQGECLATIGDALSQLGSPERFDDEKEDEDDHPCPERGEEERADHRDDRIAEGVPKSVLGRHAEGHVTRVGLPAKHRTTPLQGRVRAQTIIMVRQVTSQPAIRERSVPSKRGLGVSPGSMAYPLRLTRHQSPLSRPIAL